MNSDLSHRNRYHILVTIALQLLFGASLRANSYQVVYGSFSWLEAKADAENKGGHLATITSGDEWDLISASVGILDDQFWLGASDAAVEGNWQWITGEEWSYTRWAPGEPSGYGLYGKEDYLTVYGYLDGLWNDSQQHHLGFGNGGYILEFETGTSVPDSAHSLFLLTLSCALLFNFSRSTSGFIASRFES
jgi:hypothetical protein